MHQILCTYHSLLKTRIHRKYYNIHQELNLFPYKMMYSTTNVLSPSKRFLLPISIILMVTIFLGSLEKVDGKVDTIKKCKQGVVKATKLIIKAAKSNASIPIKTLKSQLKALVKTIKLFKKSQIKSIK